MEQAKIYSRTQAYRLLFIRLYNIRGIRFLLAGVFNSLFGLAAFSLIILFGGPVWLAILFGQVLGIFFNFVTYGGFVFRDLVLSRMPRFVFTYFSLYLINLISLKFLLNLVTISSIALQATLTIPLAALSYVIMNKLVFHSRMK